MDIPIPNEIISEILSNLGKNDLLVCRLVNQTWNGLSLKILRNPKYGHEYELTQDNIQDFLEFWKERKEEWVLPFDVNFWRGEDEESVDYQQIPNYLQQLQTIFGQKCVSSLTLIHESSLSLESVKELISILTLLAPSITYLDLSKFKLKLQEKEEMNKMEEMLRNSELYFPNLSKLISCPSATWLNEDNVLENQNNEIHEFLLDWCDDLKELEVISSYDLMDIHNHIGSLRKLKIVEPLEDIDDYLKSRRPCHSQPVLRALSLTYSTASLDHEILNEFLTSFSTTLQSLTIIFEQVPTTSFPRLSHLKFLQIQVLPRPPNTTRYYTDLQALSLNSETFPVLESIDISTNMHLGSTDENSEDSEDDWSLPTVKNLIIRITGSPFDSNVTAKDYVNNLQQIFPNVTSLTLVSEGYGYEEYLNQLLISFIQSDGAPKIQELELKDCGKNYLGHILNGLDLDHQPFVIIKNLSLRGGFYQAIKKAFEAVSGESKLTIDQQMEFKDEVQDTVFTIKASIQFKMTGLEKIHLSCSKEFRPWILRMDQEPKQKDVFLMSLPKHLPLLRQIDISQLMRGQLNYKRNCARAQLRL